MTKNNAAVKSVLAGFLAGASAAGLLCGYEFSRNCATSLFLHVFSSAKISHALTLVPIALIALIYLYGVVLSKIGPKRTIVFFHLLSMLFFVISYFLVSGEMKSMVFFLYIFAQIYIVVIVEQYWSFINSTLNKDTAKKFNGPIAGIAALGPVTGGFLLKSYAQTVGTEIFLIYAALTSIPAILLILLAYHIGGEPEPTVKEAGGKQGHLHLGVIKENKPLFIILIMVLLSQVVSISTELRFLSLSKEVFADKDANTAFIGGFFMYINLVGFFLQFFGAPLLLKFLRPKIMMICIPVVHIIMAFFILISPKLSAAAIAPLTVFFPSSWSISPMLFAVAVAFMLFKSIDYSLFRAGKELFYIPLSFDSRYRAKQIIDAFGYRFGKGAAAGGFSLVSIILQHTPPVILYPLVSLTAAIGWLAAAVKMPPLEPRKK